MIISVCHTDGESSSMQCSEEISVCTALRSSKSMINNICDKHFFNVSYFKKEEPIQILADHVLRQAKATLDPLRQETPVM